MRESVREYLVCVGWKTSWRPRRKTTSAHLSARVVLRTTAE